MRVTNISSKQQLTLSKDELRYLGIQKLGKVIIKPSKNILLVKPLNTSIVEQTAGSLTPYVHSSKRGVPFNKILKETKKKIAKKLVMGK